MNKETKNTNIALPFILVSDKTISDILKQNGYVCVNETDTMCTFMNNGKLTFSDSIDNKKIVYSNKLCF